MKASNERHFVTVLGQRGVRQDVIQANRVIETDEVRVTTINPVDVSHRGDYDVVATNSCGPTTSNAATLHVILPCPGDVTGDGYVNVNDLLLVINGWGVCP